MAGPAWAQHHGGGGHGGGFHGGGFHGGGFHSGGFHGGGFHSGGFHSGGFHSGNFHPGGFHAHNFHGRTFHHRGYYPGYYYGYYPFYGSYYYPSYGYYPPYDLGYGSAPDLGNLDSYGGVAPSYSSGYQGFQPPSTVNPNTATAQPDLTAHVTVIVPADAELWVDGSKTTSRGSVREFQSPPLEPGRYAYDFRAHWMENGREMTQTQTVAVSPGAHITVDFPVRSGTD
jgi:uncharacterized protein (TIGR03000 family)